MTDLPQFQIGLGWPLNSGCSDDWNAGVYREGATEPWTQQVVTALLLASQKKRVLELGSFKGHTTAWLAAGLASQGGGTLTTVDLMSEQSAITRDRLARMTLPHVAWDIVTQDSLDFLRHSPAESYDFVWVDDCHDANHVGEELELLLRPGGPGTGVLAPGGFLCMHDVVGPHGLGAVCRRFGGVIMPFPQLGSDGGLGVIVKPGA